MYQKQTNKNISIMTHPNLGLNIPHEFSVTYLTEVVEEFTTDSIEYHTAVQNIVDFWTKDISK